MYICLILSWQQSWELEMTERSYFFFRWRKLMFRDDNCPVQGQGASQWGRFWFLGVFWLWFLRILSVCRGKEEQSQSAGGACLFLPASCCLPALCHHPAWASRLWLESGLRSRMPFSHSISSQWSHFRVTPDVCSLQVPLHTGWRRPFLQEIDRR